VRLPEASEKASAKEASAEAATLTPPDSGILASIAAKSSKATARYTAPQRAEYEQALRYALKDSSASLVDRVQSVPPSASEMSVKQAAFSTEQRNELERINKLVPTKQMKQIEAEIGAQGVISTQKLNSKTLDWLDALTSALTDGKSATILDFIKLGTRGFLRLNGLAAFDNEARTSGDLLKLLNIGVDEAEKKGKLDLTVASFSSELTPPDCRSPISLDRKLLNALAVISVPRAQVFSQSMSALPTSVSFGLQLKQAVEAKGFELLNSFLRSLFNTGIRVAGTISTEIEKLRVRPGPGGQRFTSDIHEYPVWENAILVSMMQGSPLSQNSFTRAAVI